MPDGELVVATYNIHGGVGTDGRFLPTRVADVIREMDADVVGLQEVDRRVRRERPTLELEMLAGQSNLACFAGPTIVHPEGDYGNGLLTRHPVRAVRYLDLSVKRREPRGAIDADIEVDGVPLRVVVTHLGLGIPERLSQVTQLLTSLGELDGRRVVLLGDVNEWHPFSPSLRMLEARLGPSARGRTFPSRYPLLALDRIWSSPREAIVTARVHATPLARVASDHLPLVAHVRYRDVGAAVGGETRAAR